MLCGLHYNIITKYHFMVSSINDSAITYVKTITKPSCKVLGDKSLAFAQILRDDK